jgi:hypothetical protein
LEERGETQKIPARKFPNPNKRKLFPLERRKEFKHNEKGGETKINRGKHKNFNIQFFL